MTALAPTALHRALDSGMPITDCLIIDAHAHWMTDIAPVRTLIHPEPEGQLVMMDRLGVNISCISSVHPQANDGVIDAMQRFPDRFIGFASVNPRYESEMYAELERCFAAGMKGIGELHPTTYGHNLPVTSRRFLPAWEFAVRHGCPVLIHSGPTSERGLCGPEEIAKVAANYPSVPFIIGHCGAYDSWTMLDEAIYAAQGHDNIYLEICAMGRFYGVIEYMVNRIGAGRILYGSDAPLHDFTAEMAHVAYARISDDAKEKIFGLNMKGLLRI